MKLARPVCLGLTVLAVLAIALPASAGEASRFSLRLSGGGAYTMGGDINAGQEGYMQYWGTLASVIGYDVQGEFKNARLGPSFAADFVFQVTPWLGIGVGAEFVSASRRTLYTLTAPGFNYDMTSTPRFSAIPIKLGLFLTAYDSATFRFVLNAGVGYYIGKAGSEWMLSGSGGTQAETTDLTANGLGFHGGMAFEFRLSSSLGLLLELAGRYARFTGWKGSTTFDYPGGSEIQNGNAYYFEIDNGYYLYPVVYVSDRAPDSVTGLRDARMDFSGGSVRLGIIIRL
jgi:hypothetical protein